VLVHLQVHCFWESLKILKKIMEAAVDYMGLDIILGHMTEMSSHL